MKYYHVHVQEAEDISYSVWFETEDVLSSKEAITAKAVDLNKIDADVIPFVDEANETTFEDYRDALDLTVYDEHQIIETDVPIIREGHYIPEGSSGVVVSVHNNGEGYTVEFPQIKNNPVITCYPYELSKAINED